MLKQSWCFKVRTTSSFQTKWCTIHNIFGQTQVKIIIQLKLIHLNLNSEIENRVDFSENSSVHHQHTTTVQFNQTMEWLGLNKAIQSNNLVWA